MDKKLNTCVGREPVMSSLVRMDDAVTRLDEEYNLKLLHEYGIDAQDMLLRMSEQEFLCYLKGQGIEPVIGMNEAGAAYMRSLCLGFNDVIMAQ